MRAVSIVWFRNDLRIEDNAALTAAVDRGGSIVPIFIWAPEEEGDWPPGSASRWWLHQSLKAMQKKLKSLGSRLILRKGPSEKTLSSLAKETNASAIYWNRQYEPALRKRDQQVEKHLSELLEIVATFNGNLMFEPDEIRTKQGDPYRVFTPFWKRCQDRDEPREPLPAPEKLASPKSWPNSEELDTFELEPKIDWAGGMQETWTPGEDGADERLTRFLQQSAKNYKTQRDYPGERGTSELSPHLHFGEISPYQIWHAVRHVTGDDLRTTAGKSGQTYLSELGWREFAHHVLFHYPHTTDQPLNEKFQKFPWKSNKSASKAWQRGQTGIPIVDAGMRQLWETGWMHNRVRMVVASFLTKDLQITWLEGAKWFWDTLVDADLANNTLGWQWAGGCGADAAPYFRIFNPMTQGKKFDKEGHYVHHYVPELEGLPAACLHEPWEAKTSVLSQANVELGEDYPEPIVDHSNARKEALEAFEKVKG
ncbi:MAG: deoxyribodipyrimidine photo-lyase [Planctomycetaceae bacterium]|nr:deoxyribodipyrimidine photo-lyase [Planctomycetaceae bacterium]